MYHQLMGKFSFHLLVIIVICVGLGLRLYPGKDHFLWNTSDYPRDRYESVKIITEKDFKLLGPRAEVFDKRQNEYTVFHGPLYYYFIAPFYYLSNGDPNLVVVASILLHLTTAFGIGLLTNELVKNKYWALVAVALFMFSYEQIEYSRWLLNPALAVPFLGFFFYSLWKVNHSKWWGIAAGVSLGFAIQSEIFLGYWLVSVCAKPRRDVRIIMILNIFIDNTWSGLSPF